MIDLTSIVVNSHWSDLLLALNCYSDSHQFALPLTYQQFWDTCPRGEWLLHWIIKEGSTPHKSIVHAACQCARLALPYCTDQQQRPLKCIETTERWIRGEATLEEVKQARDAASASSYAASADASAADAFAAAYASAASADASAAAAYAAAYASAASADASADASAAAAAFVAYAASAAYSAAYSAASKNQEAARQSMQLQTADLVRSLIPRPDKMVKEYERVLELKAFL